MQVLITGGAGFIGSHLAERLLAQGAQVRILDNLTTGRRENLETIADRIEFVVGDLRDVDLVTRVAAGCALIFHQAAIVSVPYSIAHPQESHDVNIQGTLNVLLAAQRQHVRRVIFASSAAVYGDEPTLPKSEEMTPAPISPYGLEKLAGEYYLALFARHYGVETVSLRYFNVFGPRQDPRSPYSGVISIFVDRLRAQQTPTIYGDGEQSRDFVYVSNVVDANLLAASTPGISGRVYNVACGARTTLRELLDQLARVLGRPAHAHHAEPRPGDIRHSWASIRRIQAELGYAPAIDVTTGLTRLVSSL